MKVRRVSIIFGVLLLGASFLIPSGQWYLVVLGGILVGIGGSLIFWNSFREEKTLGREQHDLYLEVETATSRILRSAASGNERWNVVCPSLPKVEEKVGER